MSRKRAGTSTATRSPPSKKARDRAASASSSKSAKKEKKEKKEKAAPEPRLAPSKLKAKPVPEKASGKAPVSGKGKKKDVHAQGSPDLEDDGLEIVSNDELQGSEDSGEGEDVEAVETDAEAELDQLMRGWNAPIYCFFEQRPLIQEKDGRRSHVFKCAKMDCKAKNGVRRYLDTQDSTSTSNLKRHVDTCWGPNALKIAQGIGSVADAREQIFDKILSQVPLTAHFERKKGGSVSYMHRNFNKVETRTEIVRWVCESARPFNVVKDRGFLTLMKTGRPGYYVPSPSTVSRDVKTVFARSRNRIAKLLQDYEGKLHFTTDAWTSPNHHSFIALCAHFEHRGVPISVLLDVVEVARSHTGVNLAQAFADVLKEFGIDAKCKAVTCDNASNNDTMVAELEELLSGFEGPRGRVRCFLHILSLVAKAFIGSFDARPDKEGAQQEKEEKELLALLGDLEEAEKIAGARSPGEKAECGDEDEDEDDKDDPSDEVDAMEQLSPAERKKFENDIHPIKMALAKIRTLGFKIINSTTKLLPAWKATCEEKGLAVRLLPRDVRTRWNSTYDMLSFAVEYHEVVDAMTMRPGNALRAYELSPQAWTLLRQLRRVLKVFKRATLYFSRADAPYITDVIPTMDHVDHKLTDTSLEEEKYHDAIRVACRLAKRTLNRYYSLTDLSITYRVAMVLHPQHKLDYFKELNWPKAWQDTAREIVEAEYAANYAAQDNAASQDAPEESSVHDHDGSPPPETDEGEDAWPDESSDSDEDIFKVLANRAMSQKEAITDELEHYLDAPTQTVPDVLRWWKDRREMYPHLSQMALDYLTIPASSIDVERLFSRGRLVLSHVRNRLSVQTTRAILCVGAWSLLGLVKSEDAKKVAQLEDIDGDEDVEMEDGWDRIDVSTL